MALSSTLPLNSYPDEPKVYISRTTLKLKPSKRITSPENGVGLDNLSFEWHTNVITPPNTPVAPLIEKSVHTTNQSGNQQQHSGNHQQQAEHSRDKFVPAFNYEETDDLPTKVDKFMACERYHSQYQQAMAKSTNL